MKESRDYHCSCGKLLCKGGIFDGDIEIKCKRCGKIQKISDFDINIKRKTEETEQK